MPSRKLMRAETVRFEILVCGQGSVLYSPFAASAARLLRGMETMVFNLYSLKKDMRKVCQQLRFQSLRRMEKRRSGACETCPCPNQGLPAPQTRLAGGASKLWFDATTALNALKTRLLCTFLGAFPGRNSYAGICV